MVGGDWDVVVGKVVAPFGRKGEVKVFPYTDFPGRFEKLDKVFVSKDEAGQVRHIESARPHKGTVIIRFEGIDDLSTAEGLRGADLRIREKDLVPLGKDEYYIHDIVGLDVLTTDGEYLGKVKEVLRGVANDVYVTDRAMIPAVKEFVVDVDLEKKAIIVRRVEGLVQE